MIRFGNEEYYSYFNGVRIDNIRVILNKINQLTADERTVIAKNQMTTLGDDDFLRYYSVSNQINMKIYDQVEVGYTGIDNAYFNIENADLHTGVVTGSQIRGGISTTVRTASLSDEHAQAKLNSFYEIGKDVTIAWNAICDEYNLDLKYKKAKGPKNNPYPNYVSELSENNTVIEALEQLSEYYTLNDNELNDSFETIKLIREVTNSNVITNNDIALFENYLSARSEYNTEYTNIYEGSGYATAVYKNNDNYDEDNVLGVGFISYKDYDNDLKTTLSIMEDLATFGIGAVLSKVANLVGASNILSGAKEMFGDLCDEMIGQTKDLIQGEIMDSVMSGVKDDISKQKLNAYANELSYLKEELSGLVMNASNIEMSIDVKKDLGSLMSVIGYFSDEIFGVANFVGTVFGGPVGGFVMSLLTGGIQKITEDIWQTDSFGDLLENYKIRTDALISSGMTVEDYDKALLSFVAKERTTEVIDIDLDDSTSHIFVDSKTKNIVRGNAYHNVIVALDGDENYLDGGDGHDTIIGAQNTDYLFGGIGNDTLEGGRGSDYAAGQDGNDTYIFNVGDESLTIEDYDDLNVLKIIGVDKEDLYFNIFRTGEEEHLIIKFKSNNDQIVLKNFLQEKLDDSYGNVFKRQGKLRKIIVNDIELTTDDLSNSLDPFSRSKSNMWATFVDDLNVDNIQGTDSNNLFVGNDNANVMLGFGGNDTFYGGIGNDRIFAGDDHDFAYGESNNDTIHGEDGNDYVSGGDGNDSLYGDDGHDYIIGDNIHSFSYYKDELFGGSGHDILVGDNNDILNGGTGSDLYNLHTDTSGNIADISDDSGIDRLNFDFISSKASWAREGNMLSILCDGIKVATVAVDGIERFEFLDNKFILRGDVLKGLSNNSYVFSDMNNRVSLIENDMANSGKILGDSLDNLVDLTNIKSESFVNGGDGNDIYHSDDRFSQNLIIDESGNQKNDYDVINLSQYKSTDVALVNRGNDNLFVYFLHRGKLQHIEVKGVFVDEDENGNITRRAKSVKQIWFEDGLIELDDIDKFYVTDGSDQRERNINIYRESNKTIFTELSSEEDIKNLLSSGNVQPLSNGFRDFLQQDQNALPVSPNELSSDLLTTVRNSSTDVLSFRDYSLDDISFRREDNSLILQVSDGNELVDKAVIQSYFENDSACDMIRVMASENHDGGVYRISSLLNDKVGLVDDLSQEFFLVNLDGTQSEMNLPSVKFIIDGEMKSFSYTPYVKNDRAMVSVKEFVEFFGGEVIWDENEQRAVINYNNRTGWIDYNDHLIGTSNSDYCVNGENKRMLESPDMIVTKGSDDFTLMAHIGAVTDVLGFSVNWDEYTGSVVVESASIDYYTHDKDYSMGGTDDVGLIINGHNLEMQHRVFISSNRSMIDLQEFVSAFNRISDAQIELQVNGLNQVTLSYKNKPDSIASVGNLSYIVNGESDIHPDLDVAPMLINNRIQVPLRFISEILGADLAWNQSTYVATLNTENISLINGSSDVVVPVFEEPTRYEIPGVNDEFGTDTNPKILYQGNVILDENSAYLNNDPEVYRTLIRLSELHKAFHHGTNEWNPDTKIATYQANGRTLTVKLNFDTSAVEYYEIDGERVENPSLSEFDLRLEHVIRKKKHEMRVLNTQTIEYDPNGNVIGGGFQQNTEFLDPTFEYDVEGYQGTLMKSSRDKLKEDTITLNNGWVTIHNDIGQHDRSNKEVTIIDKNGNYVSSIVDSDGNVMESSFELGTNDAPDTWTINTTHPDNNEIALHGVLTRSGYRRDYDNSTTFVGEDGETYTLREIGHVAIYEGTIKHLRYQEYMSKKVIHWYVDYTGEIAKETDEMMTYISADMAADFYGKSVKWYQDGKQVQFFNRYDSEDKNSLLMYLNEHNRVGVGGDSKDRIYGSEESDQISGLGGDDYIIGAAGEDTIVGGIGRDTIFGGSENDHIYGGRHSDYLDGQSGADIVFGGADNDRIYGNEGNDTLIGGTGADDIYGGDNDDTIYGDNKSNSDYDASLSYDDNIRAGSGNDTVFGGIGDDQLDGNDGFDVLYGNEGNDVLNGGSGFDSLYGGLGDDHLYGGTGNDTLKGGFDNDHYYMDSNYGSIFGRDIIEDSDGVNRLYFTDDIEDYDYIRYSNSNDLKIQHKLSSSFVIVKDLLLNNNFDYIYFNEQNGEYQTQISFANIFSRLTYEGTIQNDYVVLDNNNTDFNGAEGHDTIIGSNLDDTILGGKGSDILEGGQGNDKLIGGIGNDSLIGGKGSDVLDGGQGNDVVYAGTGDDILYMNAGVDELHGGHGNDQYISNGLADLYTIIDETSTTGQDSLILNADISGLDVEREKDDLNIYVANREKKYVIKNYFSESDTIEEIVLDNGNEPEILNEENIRNLIEFGGGTSLNERLKGTFTDDIINGFGGNDVLNGKRGNDIYVFEGDFGKDKIIESRSRDRDEDIIKFVDLNSDEVKYKVSGKGLLIQSLLNDNSVYLRNFFVGPRINEIHFANEVISTEIIANEYSFILGDDNPNIINGTEVIDYVYGGEGSDNLVGKEGDDFIYGENGDDLLDGEAGNDYLVGGRGNNTYTFTGDFGSDRVIMSSSTENEKDKVVFTDLLSSEVELRVSYKDLMIISKDNKNNSVRLKNFFINSDRLLEIEFTDGSLSTEQLKNQFSVVYGTEGIDNMGTSKSDYMFGEKGDDHFDLTEGDDKAYGGDGNDTFIVGSGNDYLIGGTGKDIYHFTGNFDENIINQNGATQDDGDMIIFDDLSSNDVSYQSSGRDLIIYETENKLNSVRLTKFFDRTNNVQGIQFIDAIVHTDDIRNQFSIVTGTEGDDNLVSTEKNDTIYAYDGDDTIILEYGNNKVIAGDGNDTVIAGSGNDYIKGGKGDDTYQFNGQFGLNRIAQAGSGENDIDVIHFGDLESSEVDFKISNEHLIIQSKKTADNKVIVYDFFKDENKIEGISFIDSILDKEQIVDIYSVYLGTPEDDDYHGTSSTNYAYALEGDDNMQGYDGNDYLYASSGDDVLNGGQSNDYLRGAQGNDTYVFNGSFGVDRVSQTSALSTDHDKIVFEDLRSDAVTYTFNDKHLIINEPYSKGKVVLLNFFTVESKIKEINFVDKIVDPMAITQSLGLIVGDNGNNDLEGSEGNDVFYGNKGNDTLVGNAGEDRYVFASNFGRDTIVDQDVNHIAFNNLIYDDAILTKDNDTLLISDGINQVKVVDQFNGEGSNIYFADKKNIMLNDLLASVNNFVGTSESDSFVSNALNNEFTGNGGSDNYLFSNQFGSDIIKSITDDDNVSLNFTDLNIEDVKVSIDHMNVVLESKLDSMDKVTLVDALDRVQSYNEILFGDEQTNLDSLVSSLDIDFTSSRYHSGTMGNNYIIVDKDCFSVESQGGDDSIYSTDQDIWLQVFNGGNGDDKIYAGEGRDILYGDDYDDGYQVDYQFGHLNAGNDYLNGGLGNDTYNFDQTWGHDIIDQSTSGYNDHDKVFIRGNCDNIAFSMLGDDLVINHYDNDFYSRETEKNLVGSITFKDWLLSDTNKVDQFIMLTAEEGAMDKGYGMDIDTRSIDLLIQAMHDFEEQHEMGWNNALENNNENAISIMQGFTSGWSRELSPNNYLE